MRLANFIEANITRITKEWERFALTLHAPGEAPTDLVLRDDIEGILGAIASDMRSPQSRTDQAEKGRGRGPPGPLDKVAGNHAGQRIETGYTLEAAASEFRALRASIVRLWEESAPRPAEMTLGELIRFNEALDQTMLESMKTYTWKVDRIRQQFLAILAHDLRTPIQSILLTAVLMGRAPGADARTVAQADRLAGGARRMSRMVGDLMDLTRSRLGASLPIKRGPTDLEAVLRQVVDEIEASHPGRVVEFQPSGDVHGEWDGDRLAQVGSNLLANALEHGDPATPVLVSLQGQGDAITLVVHNQGLAIPREALATIFEPLKVSEGDARPRSSSGLGLGLFIVREIATAHGGEVSVTSSAAGGTTFTVRLPRGLPAHQVAA
jgi:hypothetical protein